MIRDPHVLLKFLYDNPRAWPVRMALIEEMVRDGEMDRAKAIIRESPDDCPMPPEYPQRIHTLMTRGLEGLNSLPPLVGFEDRTPAEPEDVPVGKIIEVISPHPTSNAANSLVDLESLSIEPESKVVESNLRRDPKEGHQYEEPGFDFNAPVAKISDDGELNLSHHGIKGGAGALIETKTIRKKSGPKPAPPTINAEIAAIKWEQYSGKLNLTAGEIPEKVEKTSRLGDRISAMSLAVILHLIGAVVVSLVVINTPRPNPPKLIVTMPDVNDSDDLIVHKLTKPAEIDPSAAAMQAVNVMTSIEISSFALPEVEDTTMLDVTAMVDGAAKLGAGMRLSLDTHQQSDVNFFGISSGGKKIVFVIDATKPMLVDEKGGMFAYDKVKNEIGSMLANLNRGTKFNILVYSGKQVRAFREDLVPGLPSNLRLAMEWLKPLNSDYEALGIPRDYGYPVEVSDIAGLPILSRDVAHYTKCIQKAMEWQAAAIFCISGGYENMRRTHSPEMLQKLRDNPGTPGTPGKLDPADKARYERELALWQKAVQKTNEWLDKENQARKEQGLAPKVVLDFNQLVRDITGATRPRGQNRIGRTPATPGVTLPQLKPVELDDIDLQLKKLVTHYYRKQNKDIPSVHMVIFLGEDEDFDDVDKSHFSRIVNRNNGKMKMLRGLAALEDVTGR